MLLNISNIIYIDGGRIPFDETFDFSSFEFFGQFPASEPVRAVGQVLNRAGALLVQGEITTVTHPLCDRCQKRLDKAVSVPIDVVAAEELSNEESEDNDNIFLIQDGRVDLDEIVSTVFVLSQDTKNLCGDDCKGLCPGCGVDLNFEKCRCEKEIDPRLAALSQLLKDKNAN